MVNKFEVISTICVSSFIFSLSMISRHYERKA